MKQIFSILLLLLVLFSCSDEYIEVIEEQPEAFTRWDTIQSQADSLIYYLGSGLNNMSVLFKDAQYAQAVANHIVLDQAFSAQLAIAYATGKPIEEISDMINEYINGNSALLRNCNTINIVDILPIFLIADFDYGTGCTSTSGDIFTGVTTLTQSGNPNSLGSTTNIQTSSDFTIQGPTETNPNLIPSANINLAFASSSTIGSDIHHTHNVAFVDASFTDGATTCTTDFELSTDPACIGFEATYVDVNGDGDTPWVANDNYTLLNGCLLMTQQHNGQQNFVYLDDVLIDENNSGGSFCPCDGSADVHDATTNAYLYTLNFGGGSGSCNQDVEVTDGISTGTTPCP